MRNENDAEIVQQFTALLSTPRVASDHENIRLQKLCDGIATMAALMHIE